MEAATTSFPVSSSDTQWFFHLHLEQMVYFRLKLNLEWCFCVKSNPKHEHLQQTAMAASLPLPQCLISLSLDNWLLSNSILYQLSFHLRVLTTGAPQFTCQAQKNSPSQSCCGCAIVAGEESSSLHAMGLCLCWGCHGKEEHPKSLPFT